MQQLDLPMEQTGRNMVHNTKVKLRSAANAVCEQLEMIKDPAEDLLNEHQRRALSRRLAMLDRCLCDVEQLLGGDSPRGEMFEVINDLTDEQREKVLSLLTEARDQIRVSRECFGLEIRRE